MKVHVIFTNKFYPDEIIEVDIKNCVCIVIDTIRATSTITTILGCLGSQILIAENKEEAINLKKIFNDFILCGEERGLPPKGFDFGNSPLEISSIDLKDKNFILMTTNGTQSILKLKDSKLVFALSLLNLNYVLDCAVKSAYENSHDILILCSGEKGKIAYDDVFTSGMAIKYLMTKPYNFFFTDSSKVALSVGLSESSILDALEKSYSAKSLRNVGLGDDIDFLSKLNIYNVCPYLERLRFKKQKVLFFEKYFSMNLDLKKGQNKSNFKIFKNQFLNSYVEKDLLVIKNYSLFWHWSKNVRPSIISIPLEENQKLLSGLSLPSITKSIWII